jgi:tetratricopeptide (TPR) repeat protein
MNAVTFHNRGLTWSGKRDYDNAIADFNHAIRLDPTNVRAFSDRGDAWQDKKLYDKALADFNEAIRLEPGYAGTFRDRGRAWLDKKDYGRAIADYNEAIRLEPKDARAFNSRAWLWATFPDYKNRNGLKAVESATRACELSDWKEAHMIGALAAAYAEANDFPKAVEYQRKANKLYTQVDEKKKGEKRLKLYQEQRPYREDPGK